MSGSRGWSVSPAATGGVGDMERFRARKSGGGRRAALDRDYHISTHVKSGEPPCKHTQTNAKLVTNTQVPISQKIPMTKTCRHTITTCDHKQPNEDESTRKQNKQCDSSSRNTRDDISMQYTDTK